MEFGIDKKELTPTLVEVPSLNLLPSGRRYINNLRLTR